MEMDNLLRISMQFFAEKGDSGADSGTDSSAAENTPNGTGAENAQDDFEKRVQSETDKRMAQSGKEIADMRKQLSNLQKQLDRAQKAGNDAEELHKLEIADKEAELAEREKKILDMENRQTAIRELGAAGLYDGSDKANELVEFVMADNEDGIKGKVKAFKELLNSYVAAEVEKTFKQNGRQPNGGNAGAEDKKDAGSGIAEKIGAASAARMKQSRAALDHYLGGKN
jgi:hypothetical protein